MWVKSRQPDHEVAAGRVEPLEVPLLIKPSVGVCFLSGDEVHEMQPRAHLGGEVETGKASRVSELAMVLLPSGLLNGRACRES